jgi:CRP/FNR family cyclic AMP-dependent transcriptional regulator
VADSEQVERVAREVFLAAFSGNTRGFTWAARRIAGAMQDLSVAQGDIVYREGEPADQIYFVVSGEVKLVKPNANDRIFGGRSIIGATDLLLERPRSRTAVATAPTHLLKMRSADWLELLEDSFELTRRIVTNFASGVHALRLRPPPLGGFDEPRPSMPDARGRLNLVERILLLREVPIFAHASIQTLTILAELADELTAATGEVLPSREGTESRLIVVASGEVAVSAADLSTDGRFGRGSLVYGAAALDHASRYEARANASARAIALSLEDYFDVMEEHFGLARSALMALSDERELLLDRSLSASQFAP